MCVKSFRHLLIIASPAQLIKCSQRPHSLVVKKKKNKTCSAVKNLRLLVQKVRKHNFVHFSITQLNSFGLPFHQNRRSLISIDLGFLTVLVVWGGGSRKRGWSGSCTLCYAGLSIPSEGLFLGTCHLLRCPFLVWSSTICL